MEPTSQNGDENGGFRCTSPTLGPLVVTSWAKFIYAFVAIFYCEIYNIRKYLNYRRHISDLGGLIMKAPTHIIQILIQVAILVVMSVTLIPMAQQSDAANRQANLLGNQTAYLADQTQTIQADYEKRTRPYLAVEGIVVQEGNSSEFRDIIITIRNFGQLPATGMTFGNVSKNQRGIVIGGEDVIYDETAGEIIFIYHGECSNVCPRCTGGICACPCYIVPITMEDLPTDLIFFPERSINVRISALKSTYEATIMKPNVMHVAFTYYRGEAKYYYVARATSKVDGSWVIDAERGS